MDWPRTGLISWNRAYSVSVRDVDHQHKTLIAQIRAFQDAMLEGRAQASLNEILSNLRAYTKAHFAFEQTLMEEHAYEDYEAHKAAHAKLTQQVADLQENLNSGEVVPGVQVMIFLRHWLTDHILAMDKKLGAYLNSKGLQ